MISSSVMQHRDKKNALQKKKFRERYPTGSPAAIFKQLKLKQLSNLSNYLLKTKHDK